MRERDGFDEIDVKDTKELTRVQLIKIGKRLKELRTNNGLSLNDISFYLFSNITTVDSLERGRVKNVTLLTLSKFSVFYGVPITELFN